jgi:hypothetical protein
MTETAVLAEENGTAAASVVSEVISEQAEASAGKVETPSRSQEIPTPTSQTPTPVPKVETEEGNIGQDQRKAGEGTMEAGKRTRRPHGLSNVEIAVLISLFGLSVSVLLVGSMFYFGESRVNLEDQMDSLLTGEFY